METFSLQRNDESAKDKVDRRGLVHALESCNITADVLLKIMVDDQRAFFTREQFRSTVDKALDGQERKAIKVKTKDRLKMLFGEFWRCWSMLLFLPFLIIFDARYGQHVYM